ncbi:hypothetical protein AALO_G00297460 [Alosa alosa]|uniref:Uncharacterized protein n=1 Tax=Alosa alosa TaxID=278164 RepID=A0AAV6FDN3_9TELE|nr:hypothetical protein AALO_G00297460 [Alosa alosa]
MTVTASHNPPPSSLSGWGKRSRGSESSQSDQIISRAYYVHHLIVFYSTCCFEAVIFLFYFEKKKHVIVMLHTPLCVFFPLFVVRVYILLAYMCRYSTQAAIRAKGTDWRTDWFLCIHESLAATFGLHTNQPY